MERQRVGGDLLITISLCFFCDLVVPDFQRTCAQRARETSMIVPRLFGRVLLAIWRLTTDQDRRQRPAPDLTCFGPEVGP